MNNIRVRIVAIEGNCVEFVTQKLNAIRCRGIDNEGSSIQVGDICTLHIGDAERGDAKLSISEVRREVQLDRHAESRLLTAMGLPLPEDPIRESDEWRGIHEIIV